MINTNPRPGRTDRGPHLDKNNFVIRMIQIPRGGWITIWSQTSFCSAAFSVDNFYPSVVVLHNNFACCVFSVNVSSLSCVLRRIMSCRFFTSPCRASF